MSDIQPVLVGIDGSGFSPTALRLAGRSHALDESRNAQMLVVAEESEGSLEPER